MSSLVRGFMERMSVPESNFEVPDLWLGTFIKDSMRLRDVSPVRIKPLSGIPLPTAMEKAGRLSKLTAVLLSPLGLLSPRLIAAIPWRAPEN